MTPVLSQLNGANNASRVVVPGSDSRNDVGTRADKPMPGVDAVSPDRNHNVPAMEPIPNVSVRQELIMAPLMFASTATNTNPVSSRAQNTKPLKRLR